MSSPRTLKFAAALQALSTGQSERQVCKDYAIRRSTFRDWLRGSQSRRAAHGHQQRLSSEQESWLADWIIEQDNIGHAPSHRRVREMATRILLASGDTNPLGKRWLSQFTTRNPRVKTLIGKRIESARIKGTSPEQIELFFERFDTIQARRNIQQQDIWNMDEHGIALGCGVNSRVLGDAGDPAAPRKKTNVSSPENREWVSVIECISASGSFTRPVVIFKGENLQVTWFKEDCVPDWKLAVSKKGWTSNAIAQKWLTEVFIPETRRILPNGKEAARMLILDGHGSHVHVDFMYTCKQNGIELLFLPAHASHVLQPLDLGTFSPLKSRYRAQIENLCYLDDSAPVEKRKFVECYRLAREETFTTRKLRAGWSAAGLFPWDPTKALNSSQNRNGTRSSAPHPPAAHSNGAPAAAPLTPTSVHTAAFTPGSPLGPTQLPATPNHPRDFIRDNYLLKTADSRTRRAILQKHAKAYAQSTIKAAEKDYTIRKLEYELSELKAKRTTKKRIPIDPNILFADAEAIKAAQEEAARAEAAKERKAQERAANRKA